jgi:hypothetical protein
MAHFYILTSLGTLLFTGHGEYFLSTMILGEYLKLDMLNKTTKLLAL